VEAKTRIGVGRATGAGFGLLASVTPR